MAERLARVEALVHCFDTSPAESLMQLGNTHGTHNANGSRQADMEQQFSIEMIPSIPLNAAPNAAPSGRGQQLSSNQNSPDSPAVLFAPSPPATHETDGEVDLQFSGVILTPRGSLSIPCPDDEAHCSPVPTVTGENVAAAMMGNGRMRNSVTSPEGTDTAAPAEDSPEMSSVYHGEMVCSVLKLQIRLAG